MAPHNDPGFELTVLFKGGDITKDPIPFRQGFDIHFPLRHVNLSSSLLIPSYMFIFNIKLLNIGLLPLRRVLNQDKLLWDL
jgi:hypothetical protein